MIYNAVTIFCLLLIYNVWSGKRLDDLFYSMLPPMTEVKDPTSIFFQAVVANDTKKVIVMLNINDTFINIIDYNNKGRTPLHVAALKGYIEMVEILVETFRADINAIDDNKQLPIELASNGYHAKIVKYLISKSSKLPKNSIKILNEPKVEEFFDAVNDNDIRKVRHMLRARSIDVNSRNVGDYRRTALHVAASRGYSGIMRVLADEFDANINLEDEIGDHSAHVAYNNGYSDIVKFLLKRKCAAAADFKDILLEIVH